MYVHDFLQSQGVWFEALLHRPASSSTKRAGCVHISGRKVVKAVLINTGATYCLAVLPSTSRVDLERFSAAVGVPTSQVRLATVDEVLERFPDCEPGVVPPFGRLYGLTTVVDSALAGSSEIVIVANTRHEGLRIRFDDFLALEQPERGSFSSACAHVSDQTTANCLAANRRAG